MINNKITKNTLFLCILTFLASSNILSMVNEVIQTNENIKTEQVNAQNESNLENSAEVKQDQNQSVDPNENPSNDSDNKKSENNQKYKIKELLAKFKNYLIQNKKKLIKNGISTGISIVSLILTYKVLHELKGFIREAIRTRNHVEEMNNVFEIASNAVKAGIQTINAGTELTTSIVKASVFTAESLVSKKVPGQQINPLTPQQTQAKYAECANVPTIYAFVRTFIPTSNDTYAGIEEELRSACNNVKQLKDHANNAASNKIADLSNSILEKSKIVANKIRAAGDIVCESVEKLEDQVNNAPNAIKEKVEDSTYDALLAITDGTAKKAIKDLPSNIIAKTKGFFSAVKASYDNHIRATEEYRSKIAKLNADAEEYRSNMATLNAQYCQ